MVAKDVPDPVTGEVIEVEQVSESRVLRRNERRRVQKFFVKPSKAMQAMKNECDINNIVKTYQVTGVVSHLRAGRPKYGDFGTVADFHEAMNLVIEAQAAFDDLPASVRKRFGNDPGAFLEFASDEANRDEMERLGLVEPKDSQGRPEGAREALDEPKAPDASPPPPDSSGGGPKPSAGA